MPIITAFLLALKRLRFDDRSLMLALAAAGLYYVHFYSTGPHEFALDIDYHTAYLTYIADHWRTPSVDADSAFLFRNPPFYYWAAAAFYRTGIATGMDEPIYFVRHTSAILYLIFITFSMLTLREMLPGRGKAYYAVLAMLLFWPVGVTMAGRITCDLLMYAGAMSAIYFFIRWLHTRAVSRLSLAFVGIGFTLLGKDSSGMLYLGIGGALLLHAAWQFRRNLRQLIRPHLFATVAFALGCFYLDATRFWFFISINPAKDPWIWQSHYGFWEWMRILLYFDPLLFLHESVFNVHAGWGRPWYGKNPFMQWFIRSFILGNFVEWKAQSIVYSLGLNWLIILAYMPLSLVMPARGAPLQRDKAAYLLAFTALLVISAMLAMRFMLPNPAYADARYGYPLLTLVLVAYGKTLERNQRNGYLAVFGIGLALSACLIALSLALYLSQDFILLMED